MSKIGKNFDIFDFSQSIAENHKILCFCQFRCQFEILPIRKWHCNYFFITDYWTTNSCLVERFYPTNPRSLTKRSTKIA